MEEKNMQQIVAVAKSRGFVYPGSEIYGGLIPVPCFQQD